MKILKFLKGFILNFFFTEKLENIKKFGENLEKIEKDTEEFRAIILSVIRTTLGVMENDLYHSEPSDEWKKLQALREKIEEMERK
jgi:hypothetical protein